MFCSSSASRGRLVLAAALLVLPVLAPYAQSRSAASQASNVTVNDQVNLQVLGVVTTEIYNSFTRTCTTDTGAIVKYGQTWATTTCPVPLSGGQVTYLCISGSNVLQSSTCR